MENKNVLNNEETLTKVFECILSGRNILLHGPGGVGKSHMLRTICKWLSEMGTKIFVTATTGVAAINLSCSSQSTSEIETKFPVSTLHRFAGVGLAQMDCEALLSYVKMNGNAVKRWKKCQVLVIDEVSMLGGYLFKKLDFIARNLRNNEEPFGGIKLLLSGDFLQLPPVKDIWVFHTQEWKNLNIRPFILETPFRYNSTENGYDFFQMLLRIRKGVVIESDMKLLKNRVFANRKIHEILNDPQNKRPEDVGEMIKPTVFYSLRRDVSTYNQQELDKLDGVLVEFIAKDTFSVLKGKPRKEDYVKILDEEMPQSVSFKVGAQVMLRQNISVEQGLVNGSRGVVSEIIGTESLIIKFLSGKKVRIEKTETIFKDKYAICTRIQVPVVLGFSFTIHKSQSATLDYATVNLGPSVFCEGQAYVALSRCKDLRSLFITEFQTSCIKANEDAVNFSEDLEKKAAEEDNGTAVVEVPICGKITLITSKSKEEHIFTFIVKYDYVDIFVKIERNKKIFDIFVACCERYKLDPKDYELVYGTRILGLNKTIEERFEKPEDEDSYIILSLLKK
jgi:ATP-dependent DNA helicase PIF1